MASISDLFSVQPWVPAAAGALVLAVAAYAVFAPGPTPGRGPAEPGNSVAAAGSEGSNLAWVSSVEVDSGYVFIDQDPDDPTQPLIVWHIDEPAGVEDDSSGKGG
jgi:hypothetical protein